MCGNRAGVFVDKKKKRGICGDAISGSIPGVVYNKISGDIDGGQKNRTICYF